MNTEKLNLSTSESETTSKALNRNLSAARAARNDEFYTQYADIQKEVNAYIEFNPDVFRGKTVLLPCDDPEWSNFTKFFAQNFEAFGLKKLISTSYAVEAKNAAIVSREGRALSRPRGRARTPAAPTAPGLPYQPTLFETEAPHYDAAKTRCRGKIFVLDHDTNANGRIDIEDLEWKYLEGDGDFRSAEVRALRDEADIIVTNPPFSLFREFLAWIVEADKKFLIIGNMNAVTYKEVFPLIKNDEMWVGATGFMSDMVFSVPKGTEVKPEYKAKAERLGYKGDFTRLGNSCWFSNLDHGRRHQPMMLMTEADNIKYSKHKTIKGVGYFHYENYDAIDIPYSDAVPSDFKGVMGVPKSFLDKYCPEQFEIIGCAEGDSGRELGLKPFDRKLKKLNPSLRDGQLFFMNNGVPEKPFARILIRHRRPVENKSC